MLDVRGGSAGLTTSKGDRQIYTSRITGVDQVWRQDGPMKYPVELTGGEGHGAAKRGNIVLAIGHTIAFFEKHLLGR